VGKTKNGANVYKSLIGGYKTAAGTTAYNLGNGRFTTASPKLRNLNNRLRRGNGLGVNKNIKTQFPATNNGGRVVASFSQLEAYRKQVTNMSKNPNISENLRRVFSNHAANLNKATKTVRGGYL
jgi:precorrin-6B methylase 2